eukprot:gene12170-14245_t
MMYSPPTSPPTSPYSSMNGIPAPPMHMPHSPRGSHNSTGAISPHTSMQFGSMGSFGAGRKGDFIVLSEFSEQTGPVALNVIPDQFPLYDGFDLSKYVVKIMSVDFQNKTNDLRTYAKDAQMFFTLTSTGEGQEVYAYVHHFSLFDIQARGYVRPLVLSYLTRDPHKIIKFFDKFLVQFTDIINVLKKKNHGLFESEFRHRKRDLDYTLNHYETVTDMEDKERETCDAKVELRGIEALGSNGSLDSTGKTKNTFGTIYYNDNIQINNDPKILDSLHKTTHLDKPLRCIAELCPEVFDSFLRKLEKCYNYFSKSSIHMEFDEIDSQVLLSTPQIIPPSSSSGFKLETFSNYLWGNSKRPAYGAGLLKMLHKYFWLRHVVFSLLKGRTVVIVGSPDKQYAIISMVYSLSIFVVGCSRDPELRASFAPYKVDCPLTLADLSTLKLVGMPKSGATFKIPSNVNCYISKVDLDTEEYTGPVYPHPGIIDEMLGLKRQWNDNESVYTAHIQNVFFELAMKSFIYYHTCCAQPHSLSKSPFFANNSVLNTAAANAAHGRHHHHNGAHMSVSTSILPSLTLPSSPEAFSNNNHNNNNISTPKSSHSSYARKKPASLQKTSRSMSLSQLDPNDLSSSWRQIDPRSLFKRWELTPQDQSIVEYLTEVIKDQQYYDIYSSKGRSYIKPTLPGYYSIEYIDKQDPSCTSFIGLQIYFPTTSTIQPLCPYSVMDHTFTTCPGQFSKLPVFPNHLPKFQLTNTRCNAIIGAITVLDAGSYQYIALFDQDLNPQVAISHGHFVGLAYGAYFLELKSETCGLQRIPSLFIGSDQPSIQIEFLPSCPHNLTVNATIIGYTPKTIPSFKIELSHQFLESPSPLVVPFIPNRDPQDKLKIAYNEGDCRANILIDIPTYFSPITWSYNRSVNLCQDIVVTLAYPDFLEVTVESTNTNGVVPLDKIAKTFIAVIDKEYTVKSNCDSQGFQIVIDSPKPSSIMSPLHRTCLDSTTVTVPNYLDFAVLKSYRNNQPFENGVYRFLPGRDSYESIGYQYCASSNKESTASLSFDYEPIQLSDLTITFDVFYTLPLCGQSNQVSAYYNVKHISGFIDRILVGPYVQGKEADLYIHYLGCEEKVTFVTPIIEVPMTPIPVVIVPSPCSIGFGRITFDDQTIGSFATTSVLIDGVVTELYDNNGDLEQFIRIGTYQLEVIDSNWRQCSYNQTIVIGLDGGDKNFKLDFIVNPVVECAKGGSIMLVNHELYEYVSLGAGIQYYEASGTFENLTPGIVTDYVVTPVALNSPGCDNDAYYAFNITNNGVAVDYEGVYINNNTIVKVVSDSKLFHYPYTYTLSTTKLISLPTGNINQVDIKLEFCIFSTSVNVPTPQYPNFEVINVASCHSEDPYFIISSESSDISLNSALSLTQYGHEQSFNAFNNTVFVYYQFYPNNLSITLQWNDVCSKTLDLELSMKRPEPDVEYIPSSTCGVSSGMIIVHNYDLFSTKDTYSVNGTIFYPSGNKVLYLSYYELSSQCSISVEIDTSSKNSDLPLVEVSSEVCHGSHKGRVSIPGSSKRHTVVDPTTGRHLPVSQDGSFMLTAEINIQSAGQCNAKGSLDISFSGYDTNMFTTLIDGLFYDNGVIPQLLPGNYSVQVNITDPLCRRVLPVTFAKVIDQDTLATVDTSICESIIVTPLVSGPFDIILTDSNGNNSYYDSKTQLIEAIVEVTECIVQKKKDKSQSLAWIAGPIIGAAIISIILYKVIERRRKRNMTIEMPLKMRAFPMFTGGKVVQVEEF